MNKNRLKRIARNVLEGWIKTTLTLLPLELIIILVADKWLSWAVICNVLLCTSIILYLGWCGYED